MKIPLLTKSVTEIPKSKTPEPWVAVQEDTSKYKDPTSTLPMANVVSPASGLDFEKWTKRRIQFVWKHLIMEHPWGGRIRDNCDYRAGVGQAQRRIKIS
jgi:hypothetical protein